ncbi:MAG: hypothetical protein M3Y42_19685 [Actinomycetota bacterium]|nr:hypothetical protein [Actinomycetota bacterium]MDQ2959166.1 hypothetical protein [Actinomycetota bacterium]
MFKPSVLMLALALSSTTLWSAFVSGSMSITTALIRFLIAVPVAAAMLLVLRMVTSSYQKAATTESKPGEDELLGQPVS